MATFWRRIREIFYGAAGEEDQEVGAIAEVQPAATRVTDEGSVRLDGGVRVQQAGEELLIAYRGPLAQTGRPLFLHYGYGPGAWREVRERRMVKRRDGVYEVGLPLMLAAGSLEFCFRNDIGDWDNNNGKNWSYRP